MISLAIIAAAFITFVYKSATVDNVNTKGTYCWLSIIFAWWLWYQINEVLL